MLFWLLDAAVYPSYRWDFLPIRMVVSSALIAGVWFAATATGARWIQGIANAIMLVAGLGIVTMIYLSDGVASSYYQGLNIVLIAMFTINSYRALHNLAVGSAIIFGYVVAVSAHPAPLEPELFISALFFMVSTLAFVVIQTKLFANQHASEFEKSRELAYTAARLKDSNRKLKETEKLKDNFVANISHELRTPLTLIMGPSQQLLASAELPPSCRNELTAINRNATLLLKHVNDLLDLSKINAGEMTLTLQVVNVTELIRFVTSHFEAAANIRGVDFRVDAPENVCARIDAEKIERVLFNLISNAFKFNADRGPILVRLSTRGESLTIAVHDSGPGVPDDQKEIIFQRFRQGEDGMTRSHGGTGLGLAIAKEIISQHEGSLEVESPSGGGAIFSFSLPTRLSRHVQDLPHYNPASAVEGEASAFLAEEPGHEPGDSHAPSAEHATECASKAKLPKIMIVEDNRQMRAFTANAFRGIARVVLAVDGSHALKVLHDHCDIDLIITDIMMPGISGDQLIKEIQDLPPLLGIPIIVLSAKADDRLKDRLLEEGAHDFLQKPFSIPELRARAQNLITLKRAREALQSEVQEKSSDLVVLTSALAKSKHELESALDTAESAIRARDEFLMNLSHELRTPLTAVLGWADLILTGELGQEDVRSAVKTIERNANYQFRLVKDLLDMSRIIQGKLQLELKSSDLRDLVTSGVQSAEATARAKEIQLITVLPETPANALCDSDRIQQILWNLLSNAMKFTPRGGEVRVELTSDESNISVSVTDSGTGIPQHLLPVIFDRLRQGDSSTTKEHEGLGLGLAIAKYLVEMHGGSISVHSDEGRGATFTFQMPVDQAGLVPEDARPGASTPSFQAILADLRVVMVDDQPSTVELVQAILGSRGAVVRTAGSAEQALEMLTNEDADILISDLGMPEHDGFWLIRELRRREFGKRPPLPAIALTAYAGETFAARALQEGFQKFLSKPLVASELIAAVDELADCKARLTTCTPLLKPVPAQPVV